MKINAQWETTARNKEKKIFSIFFFLTSNVLSILIQFMKVSDIFPAYCYQNNQISRDLSWYQDKGLKLKKAKNSRKRFFIFYLFELFSKFGVGPEWVDTLFWRFDIF